MSIPKNVLQEYKGLLDWNVILAYRGSISHGMYISPKDKNSIDDKDAIAICILPIEYYFGLKPSGYYFNDKLRDTGTCEIKHDEWDIVIYELRKFFRLLIKGNPNVLSLLWLQEKHYMKLHHIGQKIIDNRDLFVGKHVYQSYVGYAKAQMHRMKAYKYDGYMGEKRKQLVDKYGFDCKNGAHLIRLLRQSIEFLTDGKLYVERHDAQELLEIKTGKWSLEQVEKEASRLFDLADKAYINSKLPSEIDYDKIDKFCVDLIKEYFNYEKN